MRDDETITHFGDRDVPLGDKQALVDDVFHKVARRYDLMNDLMSAGLHRAWKADMVNVIDPPRSAAAFNHLDVAGGTGDIAFRVVEAGGAGTSVTVADINVEMLNVGRERAAERGLDGVVSFTEGNAEALPLADRKYDAYSIAFGIRNVPRIEKALAEAFRVLRPGGRFVCLEFSTVDVPGLRLALRALRRQRHSGAWAGRGGRRRALPLSRGIDPPLSQTHGLRRDDPCGRLPPRDPSRDDRRRRRAAFRLAFVITQVGHVVRLARAGLVLAREGVLALIDPAPLPAPARAMLRLARLLERRTEGTAAVRLSAALTRLGPTYVKLGQFLATRPDVVGAAIARDLESLQDRMAPFPQAQAEAAVAAALGRALAEVFVSFGPPVAAASIAQVHRAEIKTPEGRRAVAVKVLRPGVERRLRSEISSFYFAARNAERNSAEARRLRMIEIVDTLARSVTIEMDLRLEAAAIAEMAENTRDDPGFRVPVVDWELTAKDVLTLEWIDATPLSARAAI